MVEERFNTYDKSQCWQYDIRVNNLDEDLEYLYKKYSNQLPQS